MNKFKKFVALLLTLVLIASVGVLSVQAAVAEDNETAADATGITVHFKSEAVPYVYYWNSLPKNIETQYPGVAMTRDTKEGENWYTYKFNDVTKINMIFTDKDGKQLTKELTRNTGEWWYTGRVWTTSNPDNLDPSDSIDFREESIYFVITTRFYDGDSGNNVHCWDDAKANNPDSDPAWRGDFKGLAEKLDYIKALGFSAIWITPVVTNASGYDYHGYHAFDFSKVDVRYESDDFTFDDLVAAVHEKGMKIIQDIVIQHTGNFGEATFEPLFDKVYKSVKDLANIETSMIPNERLLSEYGLSSAEEYYAQPGGTQHEQRLNIMKDLPSGVENIGVSDYEGFVAGIARDKQQPERVSHSDKYNRNNYYHNPFWKNYNWDDYATKYSQIAGDCVDLNTENPEVFGKLVDIYSGYIERGVDAFRVDTLRHIPRISLNLMFNKQISAVGGKGFYMFGEACTRHTDVWYRGIAPESAPFYTWDETDNKYEKQWQWENTPEAVGENTNISLDHWIDNYSPSKQPTSNNALLNGINYHTPDYTEASGMGVIDFPMHWNFGSASGAFSVHGSDKYYNDATWNVVYVDSHDYGPGTFNRYEGGTQAWAENMDLMFTFRGIPCIYYGSEVEFQKGVRIDEGLNITLANSGRAYFGDYLEGSVSATDFGKYTATGKVAETLNSPLSKHLSKLNAIRRAIPALQKGQYTTSSSVVSGGSGMNYLRRYTNTEDGVDSLACVSVSGGATFKGIPNGRYVDAVTGDVQNVSNGTLTVTASGKANMRVYVCCASGFTGIDGKIGGDSSFLK